MRYPLQRILIGCCRGDYHIFGPMHNWCSKCFTRIIWACTVLSGVELGSLSCMADKTWNFKYTLESSMPAGYYKMYVYDLPKTTSSNTQFTVGFTS